MCIQVIGPKSSRSCWCRCQCKPLPTQQAHEISPMTPWPELTQYNYTWMPAFLVVNVQVNFMAWVPLKTIHLQKQTATKGLRWIHNSQVPRFSLQAHPSKPDLGMISMPQVLERHGQLAAKFPDQCTAKFGQHMSMT